MAFLLTYTHILTLVLCTAYGQFVFRVWVTLQLMEYPGGGVPLYMGYIGMCGPKGYGFSAVFGHN